MEYAEAKRTCDLVPSAYAIFAVGILVRLAILFGCDFSQLRIVDEQHYDEIARNLAQSGAFADAYGLTSIRPPLFPFLVAACYVLFGAQGLLGVRIGQAVLGVCTAFVTFKIGCRVHSRRLGLISAAIVCFYPSLVAQSNLILTETLFTFLLTAFLYLSLRFTEHPTYAMAGFVGVTLGLAALTRSIMFMSIPLFACYFLLSLAESWRRRMLFTFVFTLAAVAMIAPWSIRNTLLEQTFIPVDSMGGRNFMMGNYRYTPMYRAWDAVSITGPKSWIAEVQATREGQPPLTQGQLDKYAAQLGMKFVLENPGLTLCRDLIKFLDFWGLEREIISGLGQGYWVELSPFTLALCAGMILSAYVCLLYSAIFGSVLKGFETKATVICALIVVHITFLHSIVFGHSRYHLPLIPILALYASLGVFSGFGLNGKWKSVRLAVVIGSIALVTGGWVWNGLAGDFGRWLSAVNFG